MKLILAQPFKRLWAGRDAFEAAEQLQGEVFRELEGRRTLRTEVEGAGYFVKIHRGIGWARSSRTCSAPSCRYSVPARNGAPSSACMKSACRP